MPPCRPIPFRAFDPSAPMSDYRRHLPHWRQEGATYFVTFRLADSIPRAVIARWRDERRIWLASHGLTDDLSTVAWQTRFQSIAAAERRAFEQDEAHKLLIELDACHGACPLRAPALAAEVASALRFFDGQRLRCGDFVVMPNHVHWLVQPIAAEALEKLLQTIKSFTARRILPAIRGEGPLWQKENYDRLVRDSTELTRMRQYIAMNPAKAGRLAVDAQLFDAEWIVP